MILEKIKEALLTSRKARDQTSVSVLSTLFSEVERVGKDKGNRPTTDEEALAVIKKFIANNNECIALGQVGLLEQNKVYQAFLPQQLAEANLRQIIAEKQLSGVSDVMKFFKTAYPGQYDGALLSKIAKNG